MSRFFIVLAAVSVIFYTGLSTARAEVFVIENQMARFSVSFPDTWQMINNQKPDDELTIAAPGENDFATCRVRVRDDRRYLVYPVAYSGEVQRTAFSKDFWMEYGNEFEDPYVASVTDNAGLGRGFASYADFYFTTIIGPKMQKRGLAYASLYNDKLYITECSAEISAYEKWHNAFLGVIKSVNFTKTIHELPSGDYRNFGKDKILIIQNARPIDVYYY